MNELITCSDQALHRIREALNRRDDAEAAAERARRAVDQTVMAQVVSLDDGHPARGALLARLYWDVPEVSTQLLRTAFGTGRRLHEEVGDGPPLGPCTGCGDEVVARSRTHLAEVRGRRPGGSASPVRCRPCERRVKEDEQQERLHQGQWRHAELDRWEAELAAREEALRPWDEDLDEPW